jgi:hypothetical protein
MAKAQIITTAGAHVTVEGTPEEVAAIVKHLGGGKASSEKNVVTKPARDVQKRQKPSPVNLISSLIDGGFFRKPKDLGSVKVALEEIGHYYPVTTLSPTMLRFVRRKQLRRIKEKKRWLYTG